MIKPKCNLIIVVISLSLFFSACITNKKLTYLQHNGVSADTIVAVTPSTYKIQSGDNLFVRVVTPDPQLSDMFNTMPSTTSGVGTTEQSVDLLSYPVDSDGTIQLPYAGKIRVVGMSATAATAEVEKALKTYIADASVTVKVVNNYVSLLGEVQKPGRYPVYKNRLGIFQAIALAGDLTEFGDRKKVQLIRQTSSGNIVKEFDLTDWSIMTSEYYYVMPNDVIYVSPLRGKFYRMDVFPYAVLLGTITTFVLVLNFLYLSK